MLDRGAESDPIPVEGGAPSPGPIEVSWRYFRLGVSHIVPDGLDHLLFVFGLFLLTPRLGSLLFQVSAFTLAHTLTLALSSYGVVRLAPSVVEPLIAVSIAYVAVENVLTPKLTVWRPLVVFGFGLLHGMGFAGVLGELGLPRRDFLLGLLSFNAGVEAGQLIVLVAAFVIVGSFRNQPWYRSRLTVPLSLVIAAVGLVWTVERALA
ncbi:MAG TPA: HupE/UreJ family protein [Vicinamibacteria bacterium]|nr:HupE/UreJ family protein [Vicinamibacteria bacterium]